MNFIRRMFLPEPIRVLMRQGYTYEEAVSMIAPTDLYDINARKSRVALKELRDQNDRRKDA